MINQDDIQFQITPGIHKTKVPKPNSNCLLRITMVEGTWKEDADFFGKQDPLIQFTHNGKDYRTTVKVDAGKLAKWNEEFELYGLDQAIDGPPLVIGSYDEDPGKLQFLG